MNSQSVVGEFYDIDINGEDQTRAEDLSLVDRHLIRRLAAKFLLAKLRRLGLSFKRRKSESSKSSLGLWNSSLECLLERDRQFHQTAKIPIIYDEILNGLEGRGLQVEGILRIPGSAARIRALRDRLEKQYNAGSSKFDWGETRVNDVAALMKQFLRELPQPLLTNELVEAFVVVGKLRDDEQRRHFLNLLVLALPDVHRDCLKRLLLFLDRVVSHESSNKMTLSSVSTIMAPNLFLPPRVTGRARGYRIKKNEVDLAQDTAGIVETLIRRHEELWLVSETMMETLRSIHSQRQQPSQPLKRIMCGCFDRLRSRPKTPEDPERDRDGRKVRLTFLPDDVDPAAAATTTDENLNVQDEDSATDGTRKTTLECSVADDPVINVLSRKASLERTVTSLHLEPTTTAGQVVAQFCRLHGVDRLLNAAATERIVDPVPGVSSLFADPEEPFRLFLFEVGGNIGERRLHPDAVVKEALGKNPHAKWIVKTRLQHPKLGV